MMKAAAFKVLYVCKVKNIKTMEKLQKVYFSDVSGASFSRNFMLGLVILY
jgi:hypothetical protein